MPKVITQMVTGSSSEIKFISSCKQVFIYVINHFKFETKDNIQLKCPQNKLPVVYIVQ